MQCRTTSSRHSLLLLLFAGLLVAATGCSGTSDDGTTQVGGQEPNSNGASSEPSGSVGGKGDIYGEDDRKEYVETESEVLRRVGRASALLVDASDLSTEGEDAATMSLPDESLRESLRACPTARFSEQPAPGSCSGFLVAPDVLVTAGHCIQDEAACDSTRAVFGFRYDDSTDETITNLSSDQVFQCESIISRSWKRGEKFDYGVIRLDRPVDGVEPLEFRSDGKVPDETRLAVVGYPMGLPLKITDGGRIIDNSPDDWFRYNLDAFGGHSGAAVVDVETGRVEGIHVRGAPDYETKTVEGESCYAMRTCETVDAESHYCSGTEGTRATVFAPHVPSDSSNSSGDCCRICRDGQACGDTCISSGETCHQSSGCACNAPTPTTDASGSEESSTEGSGASPTEADSCRAVLECLDGCASGETACQQDCVRQGDEAARRRLRALGSCEQRRCGDASNRRRCLNDQCSGQLKSCIEGTALPAEETSRTCSGIYQCVVECESAQTCRQSCYQAGTTRGQTRFASLMRCYESNGCGDTTDPRACLQANCGVDLERCFQ